MEVILGNLEATRDWDLRAIMLRNYLMLQHDKPDDWILELENRINKRLSKLALICKINLEDYVETSRNIIVQMKFMT